MTEKENLNPIDLLYRIVSAYPGMEREKAKQSLEEYLSNVPLQEGCSLSEQLPGIVSQYLWESVRPYTLSMNCPVAVDTALADYRKLNSTASPCILRSEEAVQAMEEVKKIASLSGYYKSRDELEQAVYPLSKAESEAVFVHLRHRLEDMLLEVIVPAVLEQEKKPPANLEAQFDLWQDLKQCQRYTVDRFALYFLAIEKGAFRVLLPCRLTHEDGVEQTYRAARIIARLTPQLADGERASLFAMLFLWTEERALRHIGTKKADANTEVMQELYLLLLDSLKRGDYRFWENQRFRELSDTFTSYSQNTKEDEQHE